MSRPNSKSELKLKQSQKSSSNTSKPPSAVQNETANLAAASELLQSVTAENLLLEQVEELLNNQSQSQHSNQEFAQNEQNANRQSEDQEMSQKGSQRDDDDLLRGTGESKGPSYNSAA